MPAKKLTSWPACLAAAFAACFAPYVSAIAAPTPDCYNVLASLPAALESVATLHGKSSLAWTYGCRQMRPSLFLLSKTGSISCSKWLVMGTVVSRAAQKVRSSDGAHNVSCS